MCWPASFDEADLTVTRQALRDYLAGLTARYGQRAYGSDPYMDAAAVLHRLDAIYSEHVLGSAGYGA